MPRHVREGRVWGTRFDSLSRDVTADAIVTTAPAPEPSRPPAAPKPQLAAAADELKADNPVASSFVKPPRWPHDASVFIASLPNDLSEEQLSTLLVEHISQYANVVHIKLIKDTKQLPAAFIQVQSPAEAQHLVNALHSSGFCGRILRCEIARAERTLLLSYRLPTATFGNSKPLPNSLRLWRRNNSNFVDFSYAGTVPAELASPYDPADPLSAIGVAFPSDPGQALEFTEATLKDIAAAFGEFESWREVSAHIGTERYPRFHPAPHILPSNGTHFSIEFDTDSVADIDSKLSDSSDTESKKVKWADSAVITQTLQGGIWEVKYGHRNDAMSAFKTLSKLPYITATWAHEHGYIRPFKAANRLHVDNPPLEMAATMCTSTSSTEGSTHSIGSGTVPWIESGVPLPYIANDGLGDESKQLPRSQFPTRGPGGIVGHGSGAVTYLEEFPPLGRVIAQKSSAMHGAIPALGNGHGRPSTPTPPPFIFGGASHLDISSEADSSVDRIQSNDVVPKTPGLISSELQTPKTPPEQLPPITPLQTPYSTLLNLSPSAPYASFYPSPSLDGERLLISRSSLGTRFGKANESLPMHPIRTTPHVADLSDIREESWISSRDTSSVMQADAQYKPESGVAHSSTPQRSYNRRPIVNGENEIDPWAIFVGGLVKGFWHEAALGDLFNPFGEVEHVHIVTSVSQPTMFAFLRFREREAAARAVQAMNGAVLNGRKIRVSVRYMNPKYTRVTGKHMKLPSPGNFEMPVGSPQTPAATFEPEPQYEIDDSDDPVEGHPNEETGTAVFQSSQQHREETDEVADMSFDSNQTADHLLYQSLFSASASTSATTHPGDHALDSDTKITGDTPPPEDNNAPAPHTSDVVTDLQPNSGAFPPAAYMHAPWSGGYSMPWAYNPYMFAAPIGTASMTGSTPPFAFWPPGYPMAPYAYAYPPHGMPPDQYTSPVDITNAPAQASAISRTAHPQVSQQTQKVQTSQRAPRAAAQSSQQSVQPTGFWEPNQFSHVYPSESLQQYVPVRSGENTNDGSTNSACSGDAPQDWPTGQYIPAGPYPAAAPHFSMGYHPYAPPQPSAPMFFPSGWPAQPAATAGYPNHSPLPYPGAKSVVIPMHGAVQGPRHRAKHHHSNRPQRTPPPKQTSRTSQGDHAGINLPANPRAPARFNPHLSSDDVRRHIPVTTPEGSLPIPGTFPRGSYVPVAPYPTESAQYHHLTAQTQHMGPRQMGVSQTSSAPSQEWVPWMPRSV